MIYCVIIILINFKMNINTFILSFFPLTSSLSYEPPAAPLSLTPSLAHFLTSYEPPAAPLFLTYSLTHFLTSYEPPAAPHSLAHFLTSSPATSYEPSAISYQPSAMSHQLLLSSSLTHSLTYSLSHFLTCS